MFAQLPKNHDEIFIHDSWSDRALIVNFRSIFHGLVTGTSEILCSTTVEKS